MSVVLLEDLSSVDVGVDSLDYVPDPDDVAADFLGDASGRTSGGFPGRGDHSSSDVASVSDPPADIETLEQAEGVQYSDVTGHKHRQDSETRAR